MSVVWDCIIFQSTLPRGERRDGDHTQNTVMLISIHAPTRGATASAGQSSMSQTFQSTLPRGERPQFYLKFTLCFHPFFTTLHPSPPSLSILFFPFFSNSTPFVHFFRCESPSFFLCASDSHLKNQYLICRCAMFYADMFHFGLIIISQIVEPKTVFFLIYNIRQDRL